MQHSPFASTPSVDDLVALIRTQASFDGTPEKRCPHCNGVTDPGLTRFDHRRVLASSITHALGFQPTTQLFHMVMDMVDEELDGWWTRGNDDEVFRQLASSIIESIYG